MTDSGRRKNSSTLPVRHCTGARAIWFLMVIGALGAVPAPAGASEPPLDFGVLNQRSIALSAQYWNPILRYVSRQSGVPLQLKMGKTAPETDAMTLRGEFAFVYTNILFTPERVRLGYQAIARPRTPGIRALIVVPDDSPLRTLADLNGRNMVFPSRVAFVGYLVPSDALRKAKINVTPTFAGNQEGAMAQLQARAADAAAVNSQVLENYARRENFHYRVLWRSEPYLDLPIMANPAVPKARVEAVRRAFIGMADDPAGRKILEDGAALLKLTGPLGFISAANNDYANYLTFYRQATPVKD
jgi:phosphonate transport system substrate-binding protein